MPSFESVKQAMNKSEREFNYLRCSYNSEIEELKKLRYFAQQPIEQLKISFDELNNPGIAWVSDKNAKRSNLKPL